MEQHNYYAAPAATIASPAYDTEAILATRMRRLGAYLLDSLFFALAIVPMIAVLFIELLVSDSVFLDAPEAGLFLGIFVAFVIFVINCYLLSESGQTIGKKLVGIKIVRSDLVTPAGFFRIAFRYLSIWALGLIPLLGGFIQLGNYLMIFGEERRCGHDLIADTHVVNIYVVPDDHLHEAPYTRPNPYAPPERHYTPPSNQDVPPAW